MPPPKFKTDLILLREFHDKLVAFENAAIALSQRSSSRRTWMSIDDTTFVTNYGNEALISLVKPREDVRRLIDDATAISDRYGLATIWNISPPPAIGGYIRKVNVFEAFVNLELDLNARPSVIQVTDLVKDSASRCEKEMIEAINRPVINLGAIASSISQHLRSALSWFFPKEIQRTIIGWAIVVAVAALVLRLFGIHVEQAGKLLLKLFHID